MASSHNERAESADNPFTDRRQNSLRVIDDRIEVLYKRNGAKPRINTRIAALKQARDRQRAASLQPQEYAQREREVTAARESLAQLTTELKQVRSEHSRLERLSQALPALNRRRTLLSQIDEVLAEGILAPEEAVERLPALLEELRLTEDSLAGTRRRLDETARELDELTVDDELLAVNEAIESLSQDRKAALNAAQRLASSAGVAADLRDEAESLLRQVHPDASLSDAIRYKVPRSVRTRAQELHERHTVVESALEQSRRALDRRKRKLEEAEKKLSELPPAEDSGPLRAVLGAIPPELLSHMAAADEDERRIHGTIEQVLRDLKLTAFAVKDAGTIVLPARAEIDAHLDALGESKRDRRDLAKTTKDLAKKLANERLTLATLLNNDPPPTDDDLAAARSARDTLWLEVRDGGHARPEDFELAVARADQLADQLRKEADRVAKRYQLELQIGDGERELAELGEELAALDRRAEELEAEWVRLWEDFAGPRPTPNAALATLENAGRLRESVNELAEVRATLASLRERAVQHIARLRKELRIPEGVASLGAENALAELPELREVAETRLALHDVAAQERTVCEERITMARDELVEADAQVVDHKHDLGAWKGDWDKLLVRAGLPAGRDTVEALADLDRLERMTTATAEAMKSEKGAEQDAGVVERFHASLETIAAACDRRFPDDEAERHELAENLRKEAKANRSSADRREFLRLKNDELVTTADDLEEAARRLRTELAGLSDKSEADGVEALDEAVRRRKRHTDLTAALAEVTATVPAHGEDLRILMADASDADPDRLQADLGELTDRVVDLDTQRTEESALSGEKKNELARLDGSAEAAQAAADAEITAAALVEESEEYLRLQIARSILIACIEEYRQSQQDPILARASQLFGRLTLGGFSGLELDQEEDSPVMLARRGTDLLGVGQLSEGTRDQLYLALRLASLELYAEEEHTLPFVVDDIFMTFDDQRARATLSVLDEMADRFQMIIFTHHDHLTDLALAELPESRVHIHPLPRFAPAADS
ncbi:hypothetical protein AB0M44_05180 [Streptosporangium subroseum]|uniref:hypothetical protein n=1 Tax=Streptosporangium subroseum TaxID=106412 RepID=UPI00343CA82E